jgi:hypothetical protein
VIDDENLDWRFRRFQLQSELFLDCGEDGGTGIGRGGCAGGGDRSCTGIRGPREREVISSFDSVLSMMSRPSCIPRDVAPAIFCYLRVVSIRDLTAPVSWVFLQAIARATSRAAPLIASVSAT